MATAEASPAAQPSKSTKRADAKEARREQLIKATMKCIARSGLSSTTMAEITQEAGLSLGIVNLHFQSKENLLQETLRHVSEEYIEGWEKVGHNGKLSNAEKLQGCIDFDFGTKICTRNKLAVWYAFWGESKARPTYQKICSAHDEQADKTLRDICQGLIDEGGYDDRDAEQVVHTYTAMVTGLSLDILIAPKAMNRHQAKQMCHNYFVAVFPRHFENE
jgi:TetR/AcrR family transcriptional repressor of bet genes